MTSRENRTENTQTDQQRESTLYKYTAGNEGTTHTAEPNEYDKTPTTCTDIRHGPSE